MTFLQSQEKEVQASPSTLLFTSSFFSLIPPFYPSPLCGLSLSQRDGLQQPALHPQQSSPRQQAEGTLSSLPLLAPSSLCLFRFLLLAVNLHTPSSCVCRISTCPYLWMMRTLSANRCRLSSCSRRPLWPETQKFLYLCCVPLLLTVPPVV